MVLMMMNKMVEYKNRYGDIYTFELNERGNIDWKGNFNHCRFGYNDNPDDLIMVDPSGGPYITLEYDMGMFGDEFKNKKVNGFIRKDDHYELVVNKN
jgi:hypothetical protein